MKQKRGISPLIATVLLIGFVIVLGALAWIFFSEQIADISEKVSKQCSAGEASMAKIDVSGCTLNEKVFYDLAISNVGQGLINGVRVRLIGSDGTASSRIEVWALDVGASGVLHFENIPAISDVKSSQVIPFILNNGELTVCEQNLVEVKCNN